MFSLSLSDKNVVFFTVSRNLTPTPPAVVTAFTFAGIAAARCARKARRRWGFKLRPLFRGGCSSSDAKWPPARTQVSPVQQQRRGRVRHRRTRSSTVPPGWVWRGASTPIREISLCCSLSPCRRKPPKSHRLESERTRALGRPGVVRVVREPRHGWGRGMTRRGTHGARVPLVLSPCQGRRLGPNGAATGEFQPVTKLPVDPAQPPLYYAPTHPKSRPLSEGQPSPARGWACRCGSVLDVGVLERRARGRPLGVGVNRSSFRIAPMLRVGRCGACIRE